MEVMQLNAADLDDGRYTRNVGNSALPRPTGETRAVGGGGRETEDKLLDRDRF